MKCSRCENPASVHLTEIVNDQVYELHLCEQCAAESEELKFKSFDDVEGGEKEESLSNFDVLMGSKPASKNIVCEKCGESLKDFEKTGKLGCPECYVAFSKHLSALIKRIQHAQQHVGKRPANLSKEQSNVMDLKALRDQLRKCVQDEAFEDAAKLRDQINRLQKDSENDSQDS